MKKFGVVQHGKIDHIAQLVYSNLRNLCSDSSNCTDWLRNLQDRGRPSKYLKL